MKRTMILLAAATTSLALLAPAAGAQGPPPHAHVLLQQAAVDESLVEIEGEPFIRIEVEFRRCVDLAGGRPVPLHAHHQGVHTGDAGDALRDKAGHLVVPMAPLTPWRNCADVIDQPVLYFPLEDED